MDGWIRVLCASGLALVVALGLGCSHVRGDDAQAEVGGSPAVPAAPVQVRDDAAFKAWVMSGVPPFDGMTPGARIRTAESVRFVDGRLTRVAIAGLGDELTAPELAQVYAAIGLEGRATGGLSAEEAARKRARTVPAIVPGGVEARANAVWVRLFDSDAEGLAADYAQLFPPAAFEADVARAGPHELEVLLLVTDVVAGTTGDPVLVARVSMLFDRLAAQGQATRAQAKSMLTLLAGRDDLDAAVAFSRRHAALGLVALPDIVDAPGRDPSRPALLTDGTGLLREDAPLDGLRIVVASSPGCAFSRAAATAIPTDPELGPVFAEHALWVADPRLLPALQDFRDWNAAHPSSPMRIATARDRWPLRDLAQTPVFHLLRDGRIVGTPHTGWMPDGRDRDRLLAWWRSQAGTTPDPAR